LFAVEDAEDPVDETGEDPVEDRDVDEDEDAVVVVVVVIVGEEEEEEIDVAQGM
jgi:hypothetical protein